MDFGDLCDRLDGYSGADVKHIAAQAARRPFLEAIDGRAERPINRADILAVIEATPASVHVSQLARYDRFAAGDQ